MLHFLALFVKQWHYRGYQLVMIINQATVFCFISMSLYRWISDALSWWGLICSFPSLHTLRAMSQSTGQCESFILRRRLHFWFLLIVHLWVEIDTDFACTDCRIAFVKLYGWWKSFVQEDFRLSLSRLYRRMLQWLRKRFVRVYLYSLQHGFIKRRGQR